MKLISMIDFVLGTESDLDKYNPIGLREDLNNRYQGILKYAKFLKHPLKLEMFVPCDDKGNVLKEPIYTTNHSDECYCKGCEEETKRCSDLQYQYEKAKEKVLFEGCSVIQQGENTIVMYKESAFWITWTNRIIEDLIKEDIILTPQAIKQFN